MSQKSNLTASFQCAKRWKEIKQTFAVPSLISPALGSSAEAKNFSTFLNSFLHFAEKKGVSGTGTQETKPDPQPVLNSSEEQGPGSLDSGKVQLLFKEAMFKYYPSYGRHLDVTYCILLEILISLHALL